MIRTPFKVIIYIFLLVQPGMLPAINFTKFYHSDTFGYQRYHRPYYTENEIFTGYVIIILFYCVILNVNIYAQLALTLMFPVLFIMLTRHLSSL